MGRGREDRFGGSKLGHQDRPGTTSPVVARETTVLTIGLQGERPYARRVGSEPSRKSASMIRFPVVLVVFGLSWAAIGQPARAEDVKPGEIKGFDAMGDKSRSFNDGWSQAPVPREQSAAKDAPDPGGHSIAENKDRPVPNANPTGDAAHEPQAPLPHRTASPSGINPALPAKQTPEK